jgi:hypothetical protein
MDSIKTVLMNYAVCALLGSIFEFIAPRRNKETFRIISSIILISVIIIPLATFDFKGAFEEQEFQFETEQTEEIESLNIEEVQQISPIELAKRYYREKFNSEMNDEYVEMLDFAIQEVNKDKNANAES